MNHYTGSVPDTLTHTNDWRQHALCAGPDYEGRRDLWFPTPGDRITRNAAVEVCTTCPVRMACLTDALREEAGMHHDRRHGIRGGLTGRQRRGLYERAMKRRKKSRRAKASTSKAAA